MTLFDHNLEQFLEILTALSLLTFFISIILIPLLVGRLPKNYFQLDYAGKHSLEIRLTPLRALVLLTRNVIGFLLLLAGVAMLFLPGQGIITIIIGIALMDFPKKRRLIHLLSRSRSVQKALNWLRRKTDKEPFIW